MSDFFSSIWNFLSGVAVDDIMRDPDDVLYIEHEANLALERGYETQVRTTRTGLYFNTYDTTTRTHNQVAHLSMHNSASASGSMSHVVDDVTKARRDVEFRCNRGRIYVDRIPGSGRGERTATMNMTMNSTERGLTALANLGTLRDRYRGGGEIVFKIIDIPVDDYFLINLILSKYVLQIKMLTDYAKLQIKNINLENNTISFNDIISNQQYINTFNKIKKSLEPLAKYCELFKEQLQNKLTVSEQTFEYLVLTSITNSNGIPNSFTKLEMEKIVNEIKTIFKNALNSATSLPKNNKIYDSKISSQVSDVVVSNEADNYKTKYIKYKNKYLSLKNFK
jgi:hypothetical protein